MTFDRLERLAWTDPAVADAYSRRFPVFTSFTVQSLLEMIGARRGDRVLDLAGGPGTAAEAGSRVGIRPIDLDFSTAMLTLARLRHPRTEAVVGSALQPPLRRGSLDGAMCNFGLLHFPRPSEALRITRELLRPGRRAAWSVWAQDAQALQIIPRCMERLGLRPQLPPAPDFFAFGTADRFRSALQTAGYLAIEARGLAWDAAFAGVEEFWGAFAEGTARTRASILALSADQQEGLRTAVGQELQEFWTPVGLRVPVSAVLAAGGEAPGPAR